MSKNKEPCVSWRDFTEELVRNLRRETEIKFEEHKTALGKAEDANERRFQSVNEFREALSNQTGTFMPRSEVESRIGANATKLSELTDRFNQREGKGSGLNQGWAYLVAAAGVVGVIFGILEAVRH